MPARSALGRRGGLLAREHRPGLVAVAPDVALGGPQRAALAAGAAGDDLAEHRDRGLLDGRGADVEAARRVDAGDVLVADAGVAQPGVAVDRGAAAAERADVAG